MTDDLTPVYYLFGIGGTIGGGLLAVRSYLNKLKEQWTSEGTKAANLADTLESNTKGVRENTVAVANLTREIRDLAVKTEERLNAHERRLDRIEERGWTTRQVQRDKDVPLP